MRPTGHVDRCPTRDAVDVPLIGHIGTVGDCATTPKMDESRYVGNVVLTPVEIATPVVLGNGDLAG